MMLLEQPLHYDWRGKHCGARGTDPSFLVVLKCSTDRMLTFVRRYDIANTNTAVERGARPHNVLR